MKKIYLLFLASSIYCVGQKDIDSLKIKDIEVPNSPALTLLDKSFSLIEISNSSNSINANLVNIKDNSVEVVPYWLLNANEYTTSNLYYGFTTDGNDVITKQNIFNDFIKKTSISLAYSTSDTLSSISFGLRSNIITVKNIDRINVLFQDEKTYINNRTKYVDDNTVALSKTLLDKIKDQPETKTKIMILEKEGADSAKLKDYLDQLDIEADIEARNTLIDDYDKTNKETLDKLTKNFNKYFNHKVFTWDVALGSSINFPDNQSDTGRLGRYGVWSTAKYSWIISNDDFFNLYGYGRLLKDQTEIDIISLDYIKNEYLDFGGKLEYQFKKVSISAEYINRIGDNKDYRLVGIIQYKIQDNLFLSGGYGKNFDTDNGNLLTLFGLKWGLSEKASVKFD